MILFRQCSCDLIINILLSILGWLPGTVHALWLIYRKMKAEEQYGYGAIKYQGNGDWVPDPNRAYYPAQPAHGQYAAPPHYGATA